MKRNCRIKYILGQPVEIMVCDRAVFDDEPPIADIAGVESPRQNSEPAYQSEETAENSENLDRAKRRARKAVYDLAACNPELDLFCTFTVAPDKCDRYSYTAVYAKLRAFLSNAVQRRGLKYVLVAEYHKDRAIHFHALMNRAFEMTDSGKRDKLGHKVYNLPQWTLGFSTAIECYGDRAAVCKYITKYITKADEKVGGRWYYHGGDLKTPEFVYVDAEPSVEGAQSVADGLGGFGKAFAFAPSTSFGAAFYIAYRKEQNHDQRTETKNTENTEYQEQVYQDTLRLRGKEESPRAPHGAM